MEILARATAELSRLLGWGYPPVATLKLVGDRHRLTVRQRDAVFRSACSSSARRRRLRRLLPAQAVRGRSLEIDGYNLLTTLEAALAGGVILEGRDGCHRDLASMHGSWRRVAETRPAIRTLGEGLAALGAGPCRLLLDRPVSNSGRLRQALLEEAARAGWAWTVDLVQDPDRDLIRSGVTVVTADSVILDDCASWVNLARHLIETRVPDARVLKLGAGSRGLR